MVLLKGRTALSLIWQELCWLNSTLLTIFGLRPSTQLATIQIGYSSALMNKTPYELLTGNKPHVSYFRVFGCKCHVYIKGCKIAKFESRSFSGIFVGYAAKSHAYRVFNITTGCVEESMNVEFDEDNGSQAGHIDHDDAGDDPPSQAIRTMGIGELIPLE